MLTFLFYSLFYCLSFYSITRVLDIAITNYYFRKIRALKKLYNHELDDEPELDPLYNVTQDVAFYYFTLRINPAWNVICHSYFMYTYYHKLLENLKDY